MKTLKVLCIITLVAQVAVSTSLAASATKKAHKAQTQAALANEIDELGGNAELVDMAQRMKSSTRSRIVQERIIDRHNRLEFGANYGGVFGGEAYLKTQSLSIALDYHITPRWSVGARYIDYSNSLTPEGERQVNRFVDAVANGEKGTYVSIDYPLSATMAVLNWYPIYGKTSFLDLGVTQFDIYFLAGGGQISLSKGDSTLYTGGLGVGAWISKHISARAELRYQTYQDAPATGARQLDTYVGTVGLGFIL